MSLHKRYPKKSSQRVGKLLKLLPIFRSESQKLALVADHTYEEMNMRLITMVLLDCINMSTRKDVAQLLKVKYGWYPELKSLISYINLKGIIDDSSYRRNFDPDKKNEIKHHS